MSVPPKDACQSRLALRHPHLTGGGFDLPPVRAAFEDHVASFGLADRLGFHPGDFFVDPLPSADVLVMGHILHDWSLEEKLLLLRKAYEALPAEGRSSSTRASSTTNGAPTPSACS